MPSNTFVVLMGMGTVFFGLVCLIVLTSIMGRILGREAAPAVAAPAAQADVADEIAQNIEAMIGSTVDTAPKAAPKHPTANESTTSKFASLNLQFGRNYDPKSK